MANDREVYEYHVYQFFHGNGVEIVVGLDATEAFFAYLNHCVKDQLDKNVDTTLVVTELSDEELDKVHYLYDEHNDENIEVTIRDLVERHFVKQALVLIMPYEDYMLEGDGSDWKRLS